MIHRMNRTKWIVSFHFSSNNETVMTPTHLQEIQVSSKYSQQRKHKLVHRYILRLTHQRTNHFWWYQIPSINFVFQFKCIASISQTKKKKNITENEQTENLFGSVHELCYYLFIQWIFSTLYSTCFLSFSLFSLLIVFYVCFSKKKVQNFLESLLFISTEKHE